MKKYLYPLLLLLLFSCKTVPEEISTEYFNIGNAYFDVEDYGKAIDYYNKALRENHPYINRIRFNLSVAYLESGRVTEALKHIDLLLLEDPQNLQVLEAQAYAYYLLGDDAAAIAVYDQILEYFEYNTTALWNKARLVKDDNVELAIELLEKMNEIEPTADSAVLLGDLYRDSGKDDDFLFLLESAVVDNPENPEILLRLAEYFVEAELFFKAVGYYDKLIDLKDYEDQPEMIFRKAEIQLCELDESDKGFKTLVSALDSGFNDKDRIKALSDRDELSEDVQVREYLKLRGYL